MSKLNIKFNDKSFELDEVALSDAKSSLKEHLLSTMSGSGATIEFDGVEYSVDATKLSIAEDGFASYLDTLTSEAPAEEVLEGTGSEYYTLAPTALTFRSTEPLAEFQEVQVNGETVDPSNYTLEEGSTIVKLSADYLKTLNTGSYEVAIVSQNKTVSGNFTVAAPELNEYGFYYNQPYVAFVDYFGMDLALFIREDNTLNVYFSGAIEACTYVINGNTMTVTSQSMGELHCEISDDGTSIYNMELATNFVLGGDSLVADEDYIYAYEESLGGYIVSAIDKTKAKYSDIKTGINGIDTVKLSECMFENNFKLVTAPKIPNTVTIIGDYAFQGCRNLSEVTIPYGVEGLGMYAFASTNLMDIYMPDSVRYTNGYAFNNCYKLTNVRLSNNIGFINRSDFNSCYSLTSITIPNGVTSIGESAFSGCEKLVEVINKSSLTITAGSSDNGKVAYYAKEVHNGTSKIVNKNGYLFYTYDDFNYLLGYIGEDVKLTLPDNYNGESYEIYNYAFYQHSELQIVTIPNSVTSIGESAFFDCGLNGVTIGNGVTSIGEWAFFGCTKLVEVINKSSLSIIAGDQGNGCVGYYAKEVHNETSKIVNQDDYLFYSYDGVDYLLGYIGKDVELTLPESYNGENYEVRFAAFSNCKRLISINIPDSVTRIGESAFSHCLSLTSITIPNSVTSIDGTMFVECLSLTSVIFNGTIAQWNTIEKRDHWVSEDIPATHVHCLDGDVAL